MALRQQKLIYTTPNSSVEVRPQVSIELVKEIVMKYYGLIVDPSTLPKELDSYCDRNFLIQGKLKKRGTILDEKYKDFDKFILKVFNSSDSNHQFWHENLTQIVSRCYSDVESHFKVSLPIFGLDKDSQIMSVDLPLAKDVEVIGINLSDLPNKSDIVTMKDCVYYSRHLLRLTVYIPGSVVDTKKMSNELAFDYGRSAALLDLALKDIAPPKVDIREEWLWNVVNAVESNFSPYITSLADEEKMEICRNIVNKFEHETLTKLKELPKQWIHNDLNDMNFIANGDKCNKINGIIDFDDMLYSYRVVDLGVMFMFITATCSLDKCLELAKHVFRGYVSQVKLNNIELYILYDIMLVRYVQTCCLSEYQYKNVDPGNEYLLISSQTGWGVLKYLLKLGECEFMRLIQE